jgi:transcriptional regulator with XRE-family HTH domain
MTHPLKAYRDREGLTQAELGKRLGVPRNSVARWEIGARKIDTALVPSVAQKTGIPPRELRPDLAEMLQ